MRNPSKAISRLKKVSCTVSCFSARRRTPICCISGRHVPDEFALIRCQDMRQVGWLSWCNCRIRQQKIDYAVTRSGCQKKLLLYLFTSLWQSGYLIKLVNDVTHAGPQFCYVYCVSLPLWLSAVFRLFFVRPKS